MESLNVNFLAALLSRNWQHRKLRGLEDRRENTRKWKLGGKIGWKI